MKTWTSDQVSAPKIDTNIFQHLALYWMTLFLRHKKKHFIGHKSRHSIGAQAQGIIRIVYEHADMFNHNIILYIIIYIYIRRPRPWQGGARQGREVVKQLTINNEQPIAAAAAAAANFWHRNWMVLCCFASTRKKLESLNHNFIRDQKGLFCVSVATFWARNLVVFCCCGCVWKSWKVSVLFSSSKVSEGTLGTFLGFLCYVLSTK